MSKKKDTTKDSVYIAPNGAIVAVVNDSITIEY
jgi:hypothetical protein